MLTQYSEAGAIIPISHEWATWRELTHDRRQQFTTRDWEIRGECPSLLWNWNNQASEALPSPRTLPTPASSERPPSLLLF